MCDTCGATVTPGEVVWSDGVSDFCADACFRSSPVRTTDCLSTQTVFTRATPPSQRVSTSLVSRLRGVSSAFLFCFLRSVLGGGVDRSTEHSKSYNTEFGAGVAIL